MNPEVSKQAEAKATELAIHLHNWMGNLKNTNGWIHSPGEFLPANVECDVQGVSRFFREMTAEIIPFILPLLEVEEKLKTHQEALKTALAEVRRSHEAYLGLTKQSKSNNLP
jgi:hypothetical protein